MSRRFLVLIGPTRTGTTSLYRYLARDRTNFAASTIKETNAFLPPSGRRAGAGIEARTSRSDYLASFPSAAGDHVLLEASPLYFAAASSVAAGLRDALAGDDVRVLATLREPVERFASLYRHVVTKRNVKEDPVPFETFVHDALAARDELGNANRADANRHAFNEGRYSELLMAWSNALGADRVRAASFDALADDEARSDTLHALYAWLGLEDEGHLATPYITENRGRQVRAKGVHAAALRLNDRLEPLFNRLPWLRDAARAVYYRANENRSATKEFAVAAMDDLRAAYTGANADLAGTLRPLLLGPLPHWCQED
ncbi:MAG: sulfotransferase domain-containing protein [Trueperaceae bacterium]